MRPVAPILLCSHRRGHWFESSTAHHPTPRASAGAATRTDFKRRSVPGAPKGGGDCLLLHLALELDGIAEQRVAPFIKWPLEVGLGVDALAFTLRPFPPVSVERKMLDVVVASLLPMADRERLAVMLAVKIGADVL